LEALGVDLWLDEIRSRFEVRRVVISLAAAQALASLESGTRGHALAAALEVSLLASSQLSTTVPLLTLARLVGPSLSSELSAKTFFPAGRLAGFELHKREDVGTNNRDEKSRDSQHKTSQSCRQCGAAGWEKGHVCKDADLVAFARAHPRQKMRSN
jgi:hypothetical protein